jgi:membrane protein implicated in regulation of membrane protease activity
LELIFWVCFGVGIGYTGIAFLLGEALDAFSFGPDMDSGGVSPLKPAVIAAFVTVFGGTGLLFIRAVDPLWALPLAATVALAVAFAMHRFIIVPLSKAQSTGAVEIQSLIGHTAKVSSKIFQGGYGQIAYSVNGNKYSSPAKAEDGGEISNNTTVEIIYIQDNNYYVRRKETIRRWGKNGKTKNRLPAYNRPFNIGHYQI